MKYQFEILNRIQNKDNYKEEKLSEDEKQVIINRISKKIKTKKKKYYKKIAAAVLCFIFIGSTLAVNDQVFAAINNKIGKTIESFFGKNEEVAKDYKEDILKETEDKGIKFIVNEVAVDGDEILISASIDYSKLNNEKFNIENNEDLKIIPDGGVEFYISQDGEKKELKESGQVTEKYKDKRVNLLLTAKTYNPNFEDNYRVDLKINKMVSELVDNVCINGNWDVTFDVNNKENVKTYNIDKRIDLIYKGENIGINFKDIRISPLLLKIRYTFEETSGDKFVRFKIIDENGNEIERKGGGGGPKGVEFSYVANKNIKSIKLIPIIQNSVGDEEEEYYEDSKISVQLDNDIINKTQ